LSRVIKIILTYLLTYLLTYNVLLECSPSLKQMLLLLLSTSSVTRLAVCHRLQVKNDKYCGNDWNIGCL